MCLVSHVQVAFVQTFAHRRLVSGELGYYFTTLELALEFIRNLSPEQLQPCQASPLCSSAWQHQRPLTVVSPQVTAVLAFFIRHIIFPMFQVRQLCQWAKAHPTLVDTVVQHGCVRGFKLFVVDRWVLQPQRTCCCVCQHTGVDTDIVKVPDAVFLVSNALCLL